MSEFVTGRGLRTPQYTYAAMAPEDSRAGRPSPSAERYVEYMLYDNYADPYQHVNLAGPDYASAQTAEAAKPSACEVWPPGGEPPAISSRAGFHIRSQSVLPA